MSKLNKSDGKTNLYGSMVALVTPMDDNGEVNFHDLDKLVQFHLDNQTNGLVILGTTGEAATISAAEREQIIKQVISKVNGRIPIIVGTGSNSTMQAVRLTQEAADLGADAALVVTPYYNKPTQNGLIAHYKAIANSVDLPIILYNVPGRTACDMQPQTVAQLANDPELGNIIGLKEAVGSPERIKQLVQLCPKNFSLLSGDDETYLDLLKEGGHGIISVTCNLAPALLSQICQLAREGNWSKCIELNHKLQSLHKTLFVCANPIPVKWILYKLGLLSTANCRLPLLPLEDKYQDLLITALTEAGMMSEQVKMRG